MTRWKGKPRSGSRGFSPRKRAASQICRIRSWTPSVKSENPIFVGGFAGYKAGMTHCFYMDDRKNSPNKGKEIMSSCTVLETPPLVLFGVRAYKKTSYGLEILSETYASTPNKNLLSRIRPGSENSNFAEEAKDAVEIRGLFHTQPYKVTSISKKIPEVVELQLFGSNEEKLNFAKEKLGKEIPITEVLSSGQYVDTTAVTKGKGTQGPVKRFGIKILKRKQNPGKGRHGGSRGGRQTATRWQVPMAGQNGYHQRCDYNKRILAVGNEDINPTSGFMNYGNVQNDYVILRGSVPGPAKRLISLRHAIRSGNKATAPIEITYLSKESKQG
ncbi:50S ribosomal protein L3 [Candidatus Undinarchaeota archaeon]